MDALHFLMTICVTGGISGGVTRRLGTSQIEIAVRENPSQLGRQESTPRMTISPAHLREPSYYTQRHSIAYMYSLLKNNLLFIPKIFRPRLIHRPTSLFSLYVSFSHFTQRDGTPGNCYFSNVVPCTCIYVHMYVHLMKRQKANPLEKFSWCELGKGKIQAKKVYSSYLVRVDQIWKMFADNIDDNIVNSWRQLHW